MLKLKLQSFGHLMQRTGLIWKDPDAGKEWRWEEMGTTDDEMVGWHHWFKCEEAPGVGDGQGSLACCSPWGRKESDMTEQLNWTELTHKINLTIWIYKMNSYLLCRDLPRLAVSNDLISFLKYKKETKEKNVDTASVYSQIRQYKLNIFFKKLDSFVSNP